MRIAVVAVTRQGIRLAERTADVLSAEGDHEVVLYLPGKFSLLGIKGQRHPYRKPLRELFGELFVEYEGIVCIMALGIVIRMIAPHLKGKTADPAVVVVDELGQNVISALSGHWGGANALTVEIARRLGANPVITTATDVNCLPAIEMVARERGWSIEPFELVKKVNAAIVNGNKVIIYSEGPLGIQADEHIEIRDFAEYSPARREESRVVLVTNRTASGFPPGTVFIRPKNLCVGIGCRRGVTSGEVKDAVFSALEESGRSVSSIKCLASVDIKKDESGLLEAAGEMGLPVRFFGRDRISDVFRQGIELSFSQLAEEKIGVGGVCEPAAILGVGSSPRLILPKTRYGRVTAAVAEGSWQ